MPFTLSTTPFLFNQQEFGDWLAAQQGSLVMLDDASWTAAGENGPFLRSGYTWDVACVTVRTDRLYLAREGSDIGVECAVGGPYWFVGKDWTNWTDSVGTSDGFTTYYAVR